MTHQEHMQAIERSACRSYQALGHGIRGPERKLKSARSVNVGTWAQFACIAVVVGIVVVVGIIMGAI